MYLRICLAAGRLVGGHVGLAGLAIFSIGIYVLYSTASGRIASQHLGVHQGRARDDSGSRAGVLDISCPVLEISCHFLEISWMAWGSLGMAWAKLVWMSSVV
jgi:hypothetical protein